MKDKLISIVIDHQKIQVENGETVLQAARKLGKEIPTMCHYEGLESHTSCMMCMVKDSKTGSLFASCSKPAEEGMDIITKDDEIIEARKTALELLLSDHVGDCAAPCQLSCPAHMDIPKMNRLLEQGKFDEAYKVVMQDIPLPSVLGRICPAPCEKACKRKEIDSPVSICILKRYAGDFGRIEGRMSNVECRMSNVEGQMSKVLAQPPDPERSRRVAIIGSGPAGLTAAYYLRKRGYQVKIFEKEARLGGELRHPDLDEKLPTEVIDREINIILNTGIQVQLGVIADHAFIKRLKEEFAAVVVATSVPKFEVLSSKFKNQDIRVFPIQSAKLAIQAIARGKNTAFEVDQFLKGDDITGEPKRFNSRFGKLLEPEFAEYLKESNDLDRLEPKILKDGFTQEEVKAEATRCLHCDCRKQDNCKLRDYSDEYAASQRRYFDQNNRQLVTKSIQQDVVIYEPAKCIKCGICVRITNKYKEKYGFTFIGRGFNVQIQIPFGESLAAGLTETAKEVAKSCPTGAISPP
ncbi:MAG: 2Fe-2S iron-sulfur cluster-binding protein [Bacteroidota bacterium]|nr:2Fe-2S iron-sulfur cluster-binding protein [Bacteroidota bacterium]